MARCTHGAFCRRRLRMFFKEDFLKCLRLYGKKNVKNLAKNSFFERKRFREGDIVSSRRNGMWGPFR